jgi:UDP-2,3-diacylglucosamine pyrophosphatase LpxH
MRLLQGLTLLTVLLVVGPFVQAAQDPTGSPGPAPAAPRPVVVISDLHMGVGKSGETWDNLEDFRWPNALRGFLEMIGGRYADGVDLVVAGDLFELWQHPKTNCAGCGPDLGCTVAQIEQVASQVISAHATDLRFLGNFADRGANRVFVLAGNHDAALMLDPIWRQVERAIGSTKGRVFRADSGVWISDNGFVVVEHGHQIGQDVNRFRRWPSITSQCRDDGQEYVERPWGEFFVQKLFNDVEEQSPLIDNLIPESVGAALHSRQRGLFGSGVDAARFIAFNIFQTSLRQKIALDVGDPKKADAWDVKAARARGFRLFADTLASDDPLRAQLFNGQDQRVQEIRKSLDDLTRNPTDLPDEAVLALCDQIKIRSQLDAMTPIELCSRDLIISTARSLLPLSRILAEHLATRLKSYPHMRILIFGHTHRADFDITVKPTATRNVDVFNSGAFQRLIDEETFRRQAATRGISPEQAFGVLSLEDDLPACYSTVLVAYDRDGIPEPELRNWFMGEADATGELLLPCALRCGARAPRCRAQ